MTIDEATKARIVAEAVRMGRTGRSFLAGDDVEALGPATSLKCAGCRGPLHEARLSAGRLAAMARAAMGEAPWHRKSRIPKKWAKRHAIKVRMSLLMGQFMMAMHRPSYVCPNPVCGRRESFYSAIARNTFVIEPLPPGASAIYDRDPDVASIVTGEDDA